MHDPVWLTALVISPGRLAGLRVLPLSAWHCHAMQLTDTRFFADENGRGPTPGELANAIAICRSRFCMKQIGIPVAGFWLRFYLQIRWLFVDWRKDARAMMAHTYRYRITPEMETSESHKNEKNLVGAPPYFAHAVNVAMNGIGYTFEQSLNMPLPMLFCLRATVADLHGWAKCAWYDLDGQGGKETRAAFALAEKMNAERLANGSNTQSHVNA